MGFIPPRDANFPAWQTKVALEVNRQGDAIASLPGRLIPLVDSSIPAVFIQNPDGSLIFTEIE